jgi:hypothetical protein
LKLKRTSAFLDALLRESRGKLAGGVDYELIEKILSHTVQPNPSLRNIHAVCSIMVEALGGDMIAMEVAEIREHASGTQTEIIPNPITMSSHIENILVRCRPIRMSNLKTNP